VASAVSPPSSVSRSIAKFWLEIRLSIRRICSIAAGKIGSMAKPHAMRFAIVAMDQMN
jgi:hypothetical protein